MQRFGNSAAADDAEELWTIRDMATHYGMTLRALRFYEDRGLIKSRRDGTARFYDEKARARCQVIVKGKQLGFTLSEIRDLLEVGDPTGSGLFELALEDNQILDQIEMLKRQRASIDRAIDELRETQRRRTSRRILPAAHSA